MLAQMVEHTVDVWGILERSDQDNRIVGVTLQGIERVDDPTIPQPAHHSFGMFKTNVLDGVDSVESVRSLREN